MRVQLAHLGGLAAAGAIALVAVACGGIGQTGTTTAVTQVATPAANVNLAQCGKDSRTITDANGLQTTISGTPRRIVTTELSFTDVVSLLGMTPVGLGDDGSPDTVIPQIRSRLGSYTSIGTRESPNFAVIAGLKPDLIIADRVGNARILDQLRTVAPTIALRSQRSTFAQTDDTALTIGAALNQCARVQKLVADHDTLMAKIKAKVPSGERRTFAFALGTDKAVTVFNAIQFTGGVLSYLGLQPAATDPTLFPAGDSSAVSQETLLQVNPQVVFYCNVGDAPTSMVDTWLQSQLFRSSDAAKAKTVYRVNQKAWSLTRGLTGSEVIAEEAVHDLYGK